MASVGDSATALWYVMARAGAAFSRASRTLARRSSALTQPAARAFSQTLPCPPRAPGAAARRWGSAQRRRAPPASAERGQEFVEGATQRAGTGGLLHRVQHAQLHRQRHGEWRSPAPRRAAQGVCLPPFLFFVSLVHGCVCVCVRVCVHVHMRMHSRICHPATYEHMHNA
jgi:hypothetical protein